MARRSVYVAGVGAITPLGRDWPSSVARLAQGHSAIAPVTRFDVSDFPCTVAATIDGEVDSLPGSHPGDRRVTLAQIAAREAWQRADLPRPFPASAGQLGVFIGAESGRASLATILAVARAAGGGAVFDHAGFGERAQALASRIDASTVSPAAVASQLAREYGASGPVQTLSLACASAAAAIVEATRAIRLGVCDVALCGGVGADVDPLMLVGFGKLSALSARGRSCPFDLRRDGFVVGEGAAMIVLSSQPGPGRIEVAGIGRSLDAYHLTKPDPQGDGSVRAMQAALSDAGQPRIDYVQAHGTSTRINDEIEAIALQRVFGPQTMELPVSSVKGALGHWIAGAGAIGFLCAYQALQHGVLFPTAGLVDPDPACALRHIVGVAQEATVRAALVNALAFGGVNASLVLRRGAA